MHFVDCGDEPASLAPLVQYNANGAPIWDTTGTVGSDFFRDLGRPFEYLCGYCEKPCKRGQPGKPDSGEVDHFRPRQHFPGLTFTWENLIYVCRQCNQAKGNQWPGLAPLPGFVIDAFNNEARNYGKRFIDPSQDDGYVNPRDPVDRAEAYFVFNREGEIHPNPDLDDRKWSIARRTIRDFDLNSICKLRLSAYELTAAMALAIAAVRTRRAERLAALSHKPTPGFPSFVAWVFNNALSPT